MEATRSSFRARCGRRRRARRCSSFAVLLRFNCGMSLETALARIAELNALIHGPGVALPPGAQPSSTAFAGALQKAMGAGGSPQARAASALDGARGGGAGGLRPGRQRHPRPVGQRVQLRDGGEGGLEGHPAVESEQDGGT